MLIPASLTQRATYSELILEGKVIRQESRWDNRHHNIYTANLVEVYKTFKGHLPTGTQVEVITEGGEVGNILHAFSATLALQPGEQGVFFLMPATFPVKQVFLPAQPAYTAYSSLQGFIRYDLPFDEAVEPFRTYQGIQTELFPALQALPGVQLRTLQPNPEADAARPRGLLGAHPAARTLAQPLIAGLNPANITAGTGAILTISGSNFGFTRGSGFVEFRNANDGGASFIKPQAADYVSWSDNTIRVRVPSFGLGGGVAGTGTVRVTNAEGLTNASPAGLVVEYAVSNVLKNNRPYLPYHVDKNNSGGYTLSFAGNFPAIARPAFIRPLEQWTCQTAINWRTAAQDAPTNALADDGINIVRFAPPGDIPANVLARTTSRYSGCEIGRRFRYFVNEIDFDFNSSVNWQFGPANPSGLQFDFESVSLHEQGHAHQLAHLILPRAVMHYAVSRGQVSRTLNSRSDIEGGNFVIRQGFRSNVCGPPRMEPLVLGTCNLPAPLISFQVESPAQRTHLLSWAVQNPGTLVAYQLERSSNGGDWYPLASLDPGAGTSLTFTDQSPFAGYTYYRIRLVFSNGTYAYSPIRRAGTEVTDAPVVQLYPNPLQDRLYLEYHAPEDGNLVLRIHDTAGRRHGFVGRRVTRGNNPLQLDVSSLKPGLYLLYTMMGDQVEVTKFVKL